MLGYKRGYVMMALDLFAWTRVSKYHSDGGDLREDYYDFADKYYSDERLVVAYQLAPLDPNDPRAGMGAIYFPSYGYIESVEELVNLPLYVTVEADRREYYENLGKWDQFVFGWDDFVSPYDYAGYIPTDDPRIDLEQPWVSDNREIYRKMRAESNDAFKTRDRWLYVNIGLRIFSVLQTAYLQGLLGGGGDDGESLSISGHDVSFHAQPLGLYRGALAASVSF